MEGLAPAASPSRGAALLSRAGFLQARSLWLSPSTQASVSISAVHMFRSLFLV